MKTVRFKIKRQQSLDTAPYWEEFEVPYRPGMNVITALYDIAKNPKTADGKATSAVAWDANCLEEVCGACTMIVNGKVRQSCSALVDALQQPICLEPMTKFPVVRDLRVNRKRMFDALKRVKAWIPIDGTYDLGEGPKLSPQDQHIGYALSKCMTCGCCLEVCPQYHDRSPFVGAAALSQVRLFNLHPTGKMQEEERLETIMGEGGIEDCGNAQNCVRVCPKDIPLTTSIADLNRKTTAYALKKFFRS
ncbi:MAG: succinate dehydrogenase iron-sulfur subunit [Deltaproteobacteria bacterium]|nr:succinate dehydrogenase iron-sulfur subunit [Deltaproteobacteria bacterium]